MSPLDAVLERLTGLYPKAIDLSLDRVRALMRRLGDPQDALPPVIHVAGTNGKGSTVAMLRAMAEAAGCRVHVYTSPHLVRFNERIRLAGSLIGDDALLSLLEEIERVNQDLPITFFEITTAAAFLAFARAPADLVLLETGLGGRLDATNLVAAPAVTVITPIAFDHMNWFGPDLRDIAAEKAGILKPGRPAVVAHQLAPAAEVLARRASELAAPLYRHGVEWQARPGASGWHYQGQRRAFDLPQPNLPGRHQIDNAGGAVAALELLDGFTISENAIAAGLGQIEWPARLQRLRSGPLLDRLAPEDELWLDGAHNPHAGAMLAAEAAGWRDKDLHVVFGGLTTRDPAEVLRDLAPFIVSLRGVAIPGAPASHTAEDVAAAARTLGIEAAASPSVDDALREIRGGSAGPLRILICGSLYLAGHVLAANG